MVFLFGATAPSGAGVLHSWGFWITHNDAPQPVRLLWTCEQLVAETSSWQHTTPTNHIQYPCALRTHNLSRRADAVLHFKPRGNWDRLRRLNVQKVYMYTYIMFPN